MGPACANDVLGFAKSAKASLSRRLASHLIGPHTSILLPQTSLTQTPDQFGHEALDTEVAPISVSIIQIKILLVVYAALPGD